MELTVMQDHLAKALSSTSRVALSSGTQMPILKNILLRTDGGRLLIGATNLEISSLQYIGAKIETAGSITVPARLITDFVSSLPKDKIEIKVENNRVHIRSGKYSSIINGISDEDFPILPTMDEQAATNFTFNPIDFKDAVNQTKIAAGKDSARPILMGVYWNSDGENLNLASTDGYRLAERQVFVTDKEVSAIIPASTLEEVLHLVDDSTKEITVLIDENQVRFKVDDAEITSQLIDGKYPAYKQLIPTSSSTEAELNKNDLARIVKIAGLFARDSGGSITINLDQENQKITLHSIASELGENTSEMEAKISGDGAVTLNSKYLSDALSSVSGDVISFGFNGKLAPVKIESVDGEKNYTHIIMPIKS